LKYEQQRKELNESQQHKLSLILLFLLLFDLFFVVYSPELDDDYELSVLESSFDDEFEKFLFTNRTRGRNNSLLSFSRSLSLTTDEGVSRVNPKLTRIRDRRGDDKRMCEEYWSKEGVLG